MIDALDQHANASDAEQQTRALADFLSLNPNVRCILTGRPTSITHFWKPLGLESPDWHFGWIAEFTEEERIAFVGQDRLEAISRLEGKAELSPRMLSYLRGRDPDELRRVRSWSELLVAIDHDTLQAACESQPGLPAPEHVRQLFALAAWELWITDNTDGIHTEVAFERFLRTVVKHHPERFSTTEQARDEFHRAGRVNEITDFAVMSDGNRQRIAFRSRTLQGFYAALWITRYSNNPSDLKELQKRIPGWKRDKDAIDQTEFWRFVTGMPPSGDDEQDTVLVRAFGVLFKIPQATEGQEAAPLRPCEWMWRCWPRLLQLAGCRLPSEWTEAALTEAARNLAQRVHAGDAPPRTKRESQREAFNVLWKFWGEFLDLCLQEDGAGEVARSLQFDAVRDAENHSKIGQYRRCPPDGKAHPFVMGSPDGEFQYPDGSVPVAEKWRDIDETPHLVTLSPYWLRKNVITNAEYELFDAAHQSQRDEYSQNDDQPVLYVNWYEATMFSRWLGPGMQLPTEAQWEAACRGGSHAAYSFGNDESQLSDYAWWGGIFGDGNCQNEHYAHAVGQKLPNGWGMHDMHGNAWEWCSDWYSKYDLSQAIDPTGPSSGAYRVNRGGSWRNASVFCWSANRGWGLPSNRHDDLGFRPAAVPSSE